MNGWFDRVLLTLRTADAAIVSGDFAIIQRHDHWHLCTLDYFGDVLGIRSVHWMAEERATKMIAEWIHDETIFPVPFEEVGSEIAVDVRTKLLADASDYLPLLKRRATALVSGFTTDTLRETWHSRGTEDALLEAIGKMIEHGQPGPYLKFDE